MLFRIAELCAANILLTTVIQKHVRSWGYAGARLEMLELKSHRSLLISWQRLSSRANQHVLKSHASALEAFSNLRSSWAATSVLVPFSVPSVHSVQSPFFAEGWTWHTTPEEISVTVSSLGPRGFKCWPVMTFQCDYHYFSLLFLISL